MFCKLYKSAFPSVQFNDVFSLIYQVAPPSSLVSFQTFSSPAKEPSCMFIVKQYSHCLHFQQPLIYFWSQQFLLDFSQKWTHTINGVLCLWLLSLSMMIMFLRFVHVVPCGLLCSFFLPIVFHCRATPLSVCLFTGRTFRLFPIDIQVTSNF